MNLISAVCLIMAIFLAVSSLVGCLITVITQSVETKKIVKTVESYEPFTKWMFI